MATPKLVIDRPRDKSLAAFKTFILEMAGALGSGEDDMTEEEWVAGWTAFWATPESPDPELDVEDTKGDTNN